MTFNQVSLLIAEIDQVLALKPSPTWPAELIVSQQRHVLAKLREYLQQEAVNTTQGIPQNLIADLEILLNQHIQEKKQHLHRLTLAINQEIEDLEQQQQEIINLYHQSTPEKTPESLIVEPTPRALPIIVQENLFQEWLEENVETTPVVSVPSEIDKISALTDLIEPETIAKGEFSQTTWYLGLDFATYGISGVLFNGSSYEQYPLYWLTEEDEFFRHPLQAKVDDSSVIVGLDLDKYPNHPGQFLAKFKPLLDLAVAYGNPSQPRLDLLKVSLKEIIRIITQTLLKLKSPSETMAIDLSPSVFAVAMASLEGVIVSCPASWSDTYRFNLREAILRASLVAEAGKIFFVEEAIASIISRCPTSDAIITDKPTLLLINFGGTTTDLALVTFPENPRQLSYDDFMLQSLAYGGDAFAQDILLEFVYPHFSYLDPPLLALNLDLPKIAEINPDKRNYLNLILQSQELGQSLSKIAFEVHRILQQDSEFTCKIGGTAWQIKRQDLDLKIILPFLEKLEQQLELILTKATKEASKVSQIICTGGFNVYLSTLVSGLLKKKFPMAALVQDSQEESELSVAIGLSRLPLFPKIINTIRHQYSDYFILLELLESITDKPQSFEEILRRLSWRGLNSRVCAERIFGFLHNNFPQGLFTANSALFQESHQSETPVLFTEKDGYYSADLATKERLHQHLLEILAYSEQKLTEPLIVELSLFKQ